MAELSAAIGDDLPVSWALSPLGEITRPERPRVRPGDYPQLPFIGMEHVEAHTMRLLGTVPAGTMKSQAVHFFPGDVLYGRLRPYLNKVFRPDFEGLCSAEFIVFPAPDDLNGRYLQYLLNSAGFVSFAAHLDEGDRPRVDFGQLSGYLVPVAPLPEQNRIVAEIEKQLTRLGAAIAALRRVQGNLERYRASVLKVACEGRLVPTEAELARAEKRNYEAGEQLLARILREREIGRESGQLERANRQESVPNASKRRARLRGVAPLDSGKLSALTAGWTWVTLRQLGELNRGVSKHRPRDDPKLYGGPYPFIQTGDVKHSRGLIREHSQTYSEYGLAQSRLWPAGTLCITIAANIAETGMLGYPACFPDSVVGFVFAGDPVVARFIEIFFQTAKAQLIRFAPATAQKNINIETLSGLVIPLPPLAEQHRIIAEVDRRFSVIDELEAAIDLDLKRAARLYPALLKRAFEGRLVHQDPSDEPVGILMQRIRAARAAMTPLESAKPRRAKKAATAAERVS